MGDPTFPAMDPSYHPIQVIWPAHVEPAMVLIGIAIAILVVLSVVLLCDMKETK